MVTNILSKAILLMSLFIFVFSIVASQTSQVNALSGSQFQAGKIISDSLFFRKSSMSVSTIQNFLNSKVPTCNTPGTCLKDRDFNTNAKSATTGLCSSISKRLDQSAARVIYTVSQACGVDAKVLLVMLQKEQGLVTHTSPSRSRFLIAMGYACPDTAPCDTEYYGFFNQVYNAARQMKRYVRSASLFNFRAGRYNYIQYSPSASCGEKRVYIQNHATAALYNYTPYTPNKATLSVGLGVEAPCGAYGNKNFWWYYNIWFGSTIKESSARFISCSGNKYLVESTDNRKRPMSATAVAAWGLNDGHFAVDGFGCEFSTFDTSLGRLLRSRDSEKLYLVDRGTAYWIRDQATASAWGLGSISQTVPKINSDSISDNLTTRLTLPRVAKSDNADVSTYYVVDNDRRIPIAGTSSGNNDSLSLIVGYGEVPSATYSVGLLQNLTTASSLNYSFKVGSDWYLLDHNNTRKINSAVAARWDTFISGPTLDPSFLSIFDSHSGINAAFKRGNYYYRLKSDASLQFTNYDYIIRDWGIGSAQEVSRLLKNKILNARDEQYARGITGNVRLIECSGTKYLVERFIQAKRPVTGGGLDSWNYEDKYAQTNDRACNYSTYSISAGRLLKSRKTLKAYYVINGKAYHVYSQSVANNWSFGNLSSLPKFESQSISDNFVMKGAISASP